MTNEPDTTPVPNEGSAQGVELTADLHAEASAPESDAPVNTTPAGEDTEHSAPAEAEPAGTGDEPDEDEGDESTDESDDDDDEPTA